jgi:hypothetical protein
VLDLKRLVVNPSDINMVQEQLEQVLKAVEVRGAEVTQDMEVQSLKQAEFLETQLEAALDEVRKQKERFS